MSLSISSATITGLVAYGDVSADFYTNDVTPGLSGTLTLGGSDGGPLPVLGVWAVNGDTSIYLGEASYTASGSGTVPWSFDASSNAIPEGAWTLEAFASDSTDNATPSGGLLASQALTVDLTAPTEIANAFGGTIKISAQGPGNYSFGPASQAITVGDNNNDTLTVTFTAQTGTFVLPGNNVAIGTQSVTFTGTAGAINSELQSLVYHNSSKTIGTHEDTITVTTEDEAGNYVTKAINVDVNCFMAGTRIRTPDGEAAVETLKRGDLVLTTDGAAKPIAWLGRQTVSRLFANPLRVLPIRIKAGALSENVPARDLLISPDHALLIDDILVHASALINGASITRETETPAVFRYYHVELDDHSLILAENTPAETFIDNVDRMNFDNWAEHEALYPDGKPLDEMPYPRAKSYRQTPPWLRNRLAERALAIGAAAAAAA